MDSKNRQLDTSDLNRSSRSGITRRTAAGLASFGAALLIAAITTGCGGDEKAERAKTESREALDAIGDYAKDRLDSFFTAASEDFESLDEDLEELKKNVSERAGKAREELQPLLDKAEAQRKVLAAKLEELQAAGEDGIEKLQDEARKAYEEAAQAIARLREKASDDAGDDSSSDDTP